MSERIIGTEGPAVIVPGRVAAILERFGNLPALRARLRGVDVEASEVLMAVHKAAELWREARDIKPAPTPAQSVPPWKRRGWYTAEEIAERERITGAAVRMAIRAGRIPASRVEGRWQITPEDYENFRAARAARPNRASA